MGVSKELIEFGFKKLSKSAINFFDNVVPKTDHAGIIRAATAHPDDLTKVITHAETYVKNGDQRGLMPMMQKFDEWNREGVDAIKQADVLEQGTATDPNSLYSQYTRPDAIESLGKLGSQTKWGRTKRTIQGPVPPNLSDKTFAQGATTPEEAIMAPSGGTTKFIPKDKDPFQIRNYAAGYAPKGQTTKVGTRKTTGRGITDEGNTRKINEMLATDPNITPEETAEFGRIMAEAAAKGMDGDHIIEVSRVANAVRNMSPERKAAYFEVMRRTGTPTGNHPKNIQILSKEMNQVVKPAEIRELDNALRKMDKRGKSLLEELLDI
tara:strand:+ start:711 stop:1679 length:969 start_codon:yes stop_codon:yes gene_type:complete